MNILIISCSLDSGSRSRVLANEISRLLREQRAEVRFLDLREHALPHHDGEGAGDALVAPLKEAIAAADAVLLAVPIYNYDVNAAAKSLVEHTGKAWENKIVGFLCAAGGQGSYMSVMSLANSLMLDFRCLIIPRFVYATGRDFEGDQVSSSKITERLGQLCSETLRIAGGLKE